MRHAIPTGKRHPIMPKALRQNDISRLERELDEALKGTFPASDPVSSLRMTIQGPQPDRD